MQEQTLKAQHKNKKYTKEQKILKADTFYLYIINWMGPNSGIKPKRCLVYFKVVLSKWLWFLY